MKTNPVLFAFAFPLQASGNDSAVWQKLFPAGETNALDGRAFLNDAPGVVVQNFAADKVQLMVDIDHCSERFGGGAAEGWVEEMEVRQHAIWGRIFWTDEGRLKIKSRQYQYLSPAFILEGTTARVLRFTSIALVNRPAMHLRALARQDSMKGEKMSKEQPQPPSPPIRSEGQKTEAPPVVQTADREPSTQTPSLSLAVPRADHDAVVARAVAAEQALAQHLAAGREKEIEAAVDQAVKAGKIVPASRDYHLAQCRKDGGFEEFKSYIASAPALLQPQKLPAAPVATGRKTMNKTEVRVARAMGVPREDFLAERAAWEAEEKGASQNSEGETR